MYREHISKDKNKKLKYECFNTLKELCKEDADWYTVFDEWSRGIINHRIKITDNKLITKIKGKVIEVVLKNDSESVLKQCKQLYKKMGFKTSEELNYENAKKQKNNDIGWSSVRKIGDKKLFIDRYIDLYSINNLLTEEEVINLRHSIYIGILRGSITNKDIIFNNGYIRSIKIK